MRKLSFGVIACYLAATGSAFCVTCTPGYYPVENECKICPPYNSCPDGEHKYSCPTLDPAYYTTGSGATECIPCPLPVEMDGFSHTFAWRRDTPDGSIRSCRALWRKRIEHGQIEFSCYASDDGDYETTVGPSKCMVDIVACDAGYEYKGDWLEASKAYRLWTGSYDLILNGTYCVPAGIGKYSPADTVKATDCPAGTSTHITTATDVAQCMPLCPGNATQLRTDGATVNIWRDKYTTPALNLRMPNGDVCYVSLSESTPSQPGICINYDARTYHATN